jgi:ABC-type multidrug transport system permease subunit
MFKNLHLLLTTIIKNLKIVLRSPSSLLLLVLGPLVLILLVGFAFGGDQVHDINIGVVTKDMNTIQPIIASLASPEVAVLDYYNDKYCMFDLKLDKVQVCAVFSEDFIATDKKVTGKITFYYDNSRYNLASYLSEYIKEKIEITSEQITLEAATNILNDIEQAVIFMQDAQLSIDQFIEDIITIRNDLAETKIVLEDIKQEIDPLYEDALLLQQKYQENEADLNSTAKKLDANKNNILFSINLINHQIFKVKNNLNNTILNPIIKQKIETTPYLAGLIDFDNLYKLTNELDVLQQQLSSLRTNLEEYDKSFQETNTEMGEKLNSIVEMITTIKVFVDDANNKIDKNIIILNNALIELNQIKEKLDENINKFSGLDQSQAETLIKPISSRFVGMLQDMTKITLVFPIILVFIIMFISILLSNINVLNEVNSQSYFRNFLVPVKGSLFVLGMFITNMIVVMFQIVILLIMARFKFGIQFLPVMPALTVVILLITSIFVLLGMSFAYFISKQQTSILLSTFTALALFLFSDIIFPPEVMPKLAAFFAKLNPMVVGERMIRKVIYHNIMLDYQIVDLLVLIGFLIFMVIIVYIAAKRNKRRS